MVILGIILLGENIGFYELGNIWTYIPSLLILWGLRVLIKHRLRHLFWPILLILVGVLWQLVGLGYLTEAEAWAYWPVVLVLLGLSIVFGRRRRSVTEIRGNSVAYRLGGFG